MEQATCKKAKKSRSRVRRSLCRKPGKDQWLLNPKVSLKSSTPMTDPEQFLISKRSEAVDVVKKKLIDKLKICLCMPVVFKKATDPQQTTTFLFYSEAKVVCNGDNIEDELTGQFFGILDRMERSKRDNPEWMIKQIVQLEVHTAEQKGQQEWQQESDFPILGIKLYM
jgi:hypothetical protein